jgi:hypothetical protein
MWNLHVRVDGYFVLSTLASPLSALYVLPGLTVLALAYIRASGLNAP